MLPPFSGRGSSHMTPNCSGGEKEFCNGHSSGTCFAFHSCPLPPNPPRQSETHLHSLHHPLRKDSPSCSNVCVTGSQLLAVLSLLPSQGILEQYKLGLHCPVTFKIAILLSNLNKTIQDHFADKKIHTQSCELE